MARDFCQHHESVVDQADQCGVWRVRRSICVIRCGAERGPSDTCVHLRVSRATWWREVGRSLVESAAVIEIDVKRDPRLQVSLAATPRFAL